MALFGDNVRIDLSLAAEAVVAGDSITAHVVVSGDGDDKVRAGRVELAYENRYYNREYVSDSFSSSSSSSSSSGGWEDVIRTERVVVATEPLGLGGSLSPSTYDVPLTLPGDDAPASVANWVEWSVTAVLDRRRARDRREKVPLTVLTPPGLYASWAQGEQVSDRDCAMSFELPTRTVGVGNTLAGVLYVAPTKGFEARAVRVELEHRMEHEDDIVRRLGKNEVGLAERTALQPGEALRLPFQIGVPSDGIPSLRAKHNAVHWALRGVCDRRLRGDYSVEAEIEVHNAPSGFGSALPYPAARSPDEWS